MFHSLLRILLTSPVRIIWFAADICGRRFRAKIMNAFMGRFGVPSAFKVMGCLPLSLKSGLVTLAFSILIGSVLRLFSGRSIL